MNSVKQLQPLELKNKLDNGEDIFLLDVREPWEYSLAAMELIECGFTTVHNLIGGIDAWSQVVDAKVPRYRSSG